MSLRGDRRSGWPQSHAVYGTVGAGAAVCRHPSVKEGCWPAGCWLMPPLMAIMMLYFKRRKQKRPESGRVTGEPCGVSLTLTITRGEERPCGFALAKVYRMTTDASPRARVDVGHCGWAGSKQKKKASQVNVMKCNERLGSGCS